MSQCSDLTKDVLDIDICATAGQLTQEEFSRHPLGRKVRHATAVMSIKDTVQVDRVLLLSGTHTELYQIINNSTGFAKCVTSTT